jgi:ADP-heptose:LPS heptosyltransferase
MKRGSSRNRLSDYYLGIPVLMGLSIFRRKRKLPSRLSRIGILGSTALGDTLLNSGMVLDLKEAFPDAMLIYFSPKTAVAATRLLGGIDEIVPLGMTDPIETIKTLRDNRVELLIDVTSWPRLTAFYAAMSGAGVTVGFKSLGQYRHWNYDIEVEHSRECHEYENYANLLRGIGVVPRHEPALELSGRSARRWDAAGYIIIFHLWASGDQAALREWPEERWLELAKRIVAPESVLVLTGGPGDVERCEGMQKRLMEAGIHTELLCREPDLGNLAATFREADLVVSVNTGIMHLAAIAGAPTVGLNGPTATHRFGPIGAKAVSVAPPEGGGFLHFGFEFDNNPVDSMSRISIDDVYSAVCRIAPWAAQSESGTRVHCAE